MDNGMEGKDNKRICSALTGLTTSGSAKAVRPEQIRVLKPQISIATIVQKSQMANFLFNYIGGTCVICEQSSYRQGTYFALYEAVRFCYITARKEN